LSAPREAANWMALVLMTAEHRLANENNQHSLHFHRRLCLPLDETLQVKTDSLAAELIRNSLYSLLRIQDIHVVYHALEGLQVWTRKKRKAKSVTNAGNKSKKLECLCAYFYDSFEPPVVDQLAMQEFSRETARLQMRGSSTTSVPPLSAVGTQPTQAPIMGSYSIQPQQLQSRTAIDQLLSASERKMPPVDMAQARLRQQAQLDQAVSLQRAAVASHPTLDAFFQKAAPSSPNHHLLNASKMRSNSSKKFAFSSTSTGTKRPSPQRQPNSTPAAMGGNTPGIKRPRQIIVDLTDESDLPTPSSLATVKQEAEDELDRIIRDESTPRDGEEARILSELKQMGFQDEDKDMLRVIRRCREHNPTSPVSSEVVMMKLVAQREEMDEARKEDRARLESERREESQKLRDNAKLAKLQQLHDAPLSDLKSKHFPNSYIFQYAFASLEKVMGACPSVKAALLPLLQIEEKAQKWYKYELPKPYFRFVVSKQIENLASDQREKKTSSELVTYLKEQEGALKTAMFTLEEQTNIGVPKLFLETYDSHQKDRENDANTCNQEGDEVIVVAKSPQQTTKTMNHPKTESRGAVIELLD